ncbi:B-cell receptor CD22-like [Osmerus mordax]|uniref:B-cell receptor CD22-like n=1 Tax=Osmerus mordax TaxID=8014 RepID=UPI00350FB597
MELRTTGSVFVVFLCSVAVVLGQDWGVTYTLQSVCALRGSSVDLSCSYTYPSGHTITKTFWFTKSDTVDLSLDPEYAGRVQYRGDEEREATLTITDLRETDAAVYKFRFITNLHGGKYTGQPGATLSVTGLQVEVTPSTYIGQSVTLTCSSTCPLTGNPSYIWYKNGQHVQQASSQQLFVYSNYHDRYSCAVEGHEDLRSPAVCVSGPNCRRVTYSTRRLCVLKGSSVDISCTYYSYYTVTSSFWFSPGRRDGWRDRSAPEDLAGDPEYAGRVQYSRTERKSSTMTITHLRERDSGEYRFTFKTEDPRYDWGDSFSGTTLTVTGLQVEVTPSTWGEKTLTCSSTCPLTGNPSYIWYKNGQPEQQASSQQLSVSSNSQDSYSCAVEGHEDLRSPAVYKPRNIKISVSPSGEVVEGSSVTLTCSSDANPPVQTYTWYQENITSSKSSGQSYTITNISSEDSGGYYCQAGNTVGATNSSVVMITLLKGISTAQAAAAGTTVSVLLAVILLSACLLCRKKKTNCSNSWHPVDNGQNVRDSSSDTYSSLDMRTRSSDYDTLATVRRTGTEI